MVTPRLCDFLNQSGVGYQALAHPVAYDAQRTAEAAHLPGHDVAKSVLLRADGRPCLAVIPAPDRIELENLRRLLGVRELAVADEEDVRRTFPDCDVGAMPPFGNLYGMEVYVSERLRSDHSIAFNAGSHDELMVLPFPEYERLARPQVLPF